MKKKTVSILTGILAAAVVLTIGCGTSTKDDTKDTPDFTELEEPAEKNNEITENPDAMGPFAGTEEEEMSPGEPEKPSAGPEEEYREKMNSMIGEDAAFQIALKDAQVGETDVTTMRVYLDMDEELWEYEVEFYVGVEEYDYEIDGKTGTILSKDREIEDGFQSNTVAVGFSEEQAIQALMKMVPGAAKENIEIELEEENGQLVYEGEVHYNNKDYEFKMSADTGEMISWEQD